MCEDLGVPVSLEKTEWANQLIIFLGILLDGKLHLLAVPEEKRIQTLHLLNLIKAKKSAMVRDLQSLAGHLNFLNRAIVPGRVFTRRMYAKFSSFIDKNGNKVQGSCIKQHHHIRLDKEFKSDCDIWISFLNQQDYHRKLLCRPFLDIDDTVHAETLDFYTDAAKGKFLGMGGVLGSHWYFAQWEPDYIRQYNPSIEYLELLAICMAVFIWSDKHLRNQRIVMFCDNQSVVETVNNTTSSCKNCMILLRKLVLKSLECNMRIFCRWIMGAKNFRADFLSRMKLKAFRKFVQDQQIKTDDHPSQLHTDLWPASRLWIK